MPCVPHGFQNHLERSWGVLDGMVLILNEECFVLSRSPP